MKINSGSPLIVYVVSNIDKALAFEWLADKLRSKYRIEFIILNPVRTELEAYLQTINVPVHFVSYTGKKDLGKAFLEIFKIFRKLKPAVIHAHLFEASLLALIAGKVLGIKNRIFTRHHGNQHHRYFPRAVYYDKLINAAATGIVAPSASVAKILIDLEGVKPEKVHIIHHGFDLSFFNQPGNELVQMLRQKYNPDNKKPVIGVIARYTELKGLQFIIPAFKQLLLEYPDALLLLANAGGDYNAQVQELLSGINKRNYIEIPFERNIGALYQIFDVFIQASVEPASEAFGQTYVEALAAGIPSVFTLSGVAAEFIADRENALVVPYNNDLAIYKAVKEILEQESLRNHLIENGKRDVSRIFALSTMIDRLTAIYDK